MLQLKNLNFKVQISVFYDTTFTCKGFDIGNFNTV